MGSMKLFLRRDKTEATERGGQTEVKPHQYIRTVCMDWTEGVPSEPAGFDRTLTVKICKVMTDCPQRRSRTVCESIRSLFAAFAFGVVDVTV